MTYRFTVLFPNGKSVTRRNQDLEDWPVFQSKVNNYCYRKVVQPLYISMIAEV